MRCLLGGRWEKSCGAEEIIVSSYAGTEFEVDEDKLLLVKAPDVLAVIKKK
jgi:co-chaperonin GroES (HSP10)